MNGYQPDGKGPGLYVNNPPRGGSGVPRSPMMHYYQYPEHIFLNLLQDAIASWQTKTFGELPPEAYLPKLVEEVRELIDNPRSLDEAADILILLLGWASAAGYSIDDLCKAAQRKHSINIKRTWTRSEDGSWRHE
jgi:hypothetical protein